MRSRTAFTLSENFRIVVGVSANGVKVGDVVSAEKYPHLPLRSWYRRGIIVPVDSRYDKMYLAKKNNEKAKAESEKSELEKAEEVENSQQELIPSVEVAEEKPAKKASKRGARAK